MGCTNERNVQILIAILKGNNIRKVVASPGVKNISFVASIQDDPYFTIYSSVDERSASYLACGIAAESGEAVVITCTEATASRNYLPGLTEAFYRKLPVLAVTCTWGNELSGNLIPQSIDRSVIPNDAARISVTLPIIKDDNDEWICAFKANKAISELYRNGGGPVHINLALKKKKNFNAKDIMPVQNIYRVRQHELDNTYSLKGKKTAVLVGSHKEWSVEETEALDRFCSLYDAVALCDHTSNFKGKYAVQFPIINSQVGLDKKKLSVDVLIHIGEVSGAYSSVPCHEVWRVSNDGEFRDTYKKLKYVFDMEEVVFFNAFSEFVADTESNKKKQLTYYNDLINTIRANITEIPFSNLWMAQMMSEHLPEKAVLHLGILNSLRAWNFFQIPKNVRGYSNVGGFGIDGVVSTLIGASLCHKDRLYFGVVGDLAFFYDMNVLGNRHIGNNIRLLLVNNGKGVEFRNYNNPGAEFGIIADEFIAAARHYGNQSRNLIRHFAEDLGFEYLSAENKGEFMSNIDKFLNPEITDKPLLFEAFTHTEDESNALKLMCSLLPNVTAKGIAKKIIGEEGIKFLKSMRN